MVIFKCDVELCEIITTNATRCVFVCFNWTTSGFMTGTSATTFSAEVEVTIICSSVVAIMELTLCHCFTTLRCHYRPNEVHLRNYHKHGPRLQRRCQHCHNDHTVLHNDHRVIHNRHIHNCNMEYSHSNSRNTNISGMGHSQMNIHNSHSDSAWDVVGSLDSTLHSGYEDNHVQQDCRNSIGSFEHPCLLLPFWGLDMACANYSFVNRVLVHILHISKKWMCGSGLSSEGISPPRHKPVLGKTTGFI